MGADSVMMGSYFARLSGSPGALSQIDGQPMKEYWMEGSKRSKSSKRYAHQLGASFEEGVDGYVPYAGSIEEFKTLFHHIGMPSTQYARGPYAYCIFISFRIYGSEMFGYASSYPWKHPDARSRLKRRELPSFS